MNESTTLVSSNTRVGHDGTRGGRRRGRKDGDSSRHGDLSEGNSIVSCFSYKEPRHIKRFYPKLIGKNT